MYHYQDLKKSIRFLVLKITFLIFFIDLIFINYYIFILVKPLIMFSSNNIFIMHLFFKNSLLKKLKY